MSDSTAPKKRSMLDRIQEFLDSLGTEESDAIEADEVDTTEAADEVDTVEAVEGDELEPGSEAEADAADNLDGADETPGAEEDQESPEDDDLRATITEQAAQIETYRNAFAAAGLPDPLDVTIDAEANLDPDDTLTEEDAITAFDEDYARQEAMLAEINKEN